MNTDIELTNGNWLLVVGTRTTIPTLLRMVGRLAETGPVRVVDGGYSFNPYIVATGMQGGMKLLDRIQVSRAFSCREMLSALENLGSESAPFVILDFLTTFFYFFEGFEQRKAVLKACLAQLNRLEQGSSGLVSIHLPQVLSHTESELLDMVTSACHDTYHIELATSIQFPAKVY